MTCPDKQVKVMEQGKSVVYTGTIYSTKCTGIACTNGDHPYMCAYCFELTCGKSSPLLRKFNRSKKLKNPRCNDLRATKRGVVHKFCSVPQISNALSHQTQLAKMHKDKNTKLLATIEKMLHSKWHEHQSAYPFLVELQKMIVDKQLSEFDASLLRNWVQKKVNGRIWRADEQARSLAILYSNKLGQKTYKELAPLLGLPSVRQAQKIRSKSSNEEHYMPGINSWAIQKASGRRKVPLQNSMDGTRVIRAVELYRDRYLVGEEFPADVRYYPKESQLPILQDPKQLENYILTVRKNNQYAAEAYSLNLCDTTGALDDIIIGCIPEAKKGVTGNHIFALMLEIEKQAKCHSLTLVGHCTDSAGNSLCALVKLASPSTFQNFDNQIKFVGLKMKGFVFYAPILREVPSIAYPCWDHSGRTSIRNLMNENIKIVCEVLPPSNIQKYSFATIHDLKALKAKSPNCKIRHADITPHMRQNCDATVRVISKATVEALKEHMPEAKATCVYLQASLWIHEPFRNENFGSPLAVTQSLWAGVMTWRRWRKYVELASGIGLQDNFISRSHYLTLELLGHAGILHQLVLYLAFPDLDIKEYSLRNTGNRSIEAMHSVLRGGTANLPITSANLTYQDFLSRLNKVNQIKRAEHSLQKITGNYICSTKKRQITNSKSSGEESVHDKPYEKPACYITFVADLMTSCKKGDTDSKALLEALAPRLVALLKKHNQWDNPDHCLDTTKGSLESLPVIIAAPELHEAMAILSDNTIDGLIGYSLGDIDITDHDIAQEEDIDLCETDASLVQEVEETINDDAGQAVVNSDVSDDGCHSGMISQAVSNHNTVADTNVSHDEAICNLLIDSEVSLFNENWNARSAKSLIKTLQPFREMPSKDRRKRFAAGQLYGDSEKPKSHDVSLFEFWAIGTTKLQNAHCFLLGKIIFMSHLGKSCSSEMKANPNLNIVFEVYEYDSLSRCYSSNGRSGFLKAKCLIANVNNEISLENEKITFDYTKVAGLQEYLPFHDDIDIDARLPKQCTASATTDMVDDPNESDPFIVNQIINKRFNSYKGQYEFLVSWVGYSDQTWELPYNIPDKKIEEYESRNNQEPQTVPSHSYGTRTKRKQSTKKDYIKTF